MNLDPKSDFKANIQVLRHVRVAAILQRRNFILWRTLTTTLTAEPLTRGEEYLRKSRLFMRKISCQFYSQHMSSDFGVSSVESPERALWLMQGIIYGKQETSKEILVKKQLGSLIQYLFS